MNMRHAILVILLLSFAVYGTARSCREGSESTRPPVIQARADSDALRVEGEKRFRANCGRCHAAPHKFPPRMMGTIVRHMRVRATITDEDMQYILFYMSE